MRLVFLYAPPATGKFTIGSELARRTGFKLLHNHLTVNLVSAVFERDSEVWLRMLRSVRRDMLSEAARHDISLIMTGVYSGTPEHAEAWHMMLEPVRTEGGSVLFVQLTCAPEELLRRVQDENRRALDKLVDPSRLSGLMDQFNLFATAPFEPSICVDVTNSPPDEVASRIIEHYRLPTL